MKYSRIKKSIVVWSIALNFIFSPLGVRGEPDETLENSNQNLIEAPGAVLMEKETGTVICSRDPDTKRSPASITKIMTLILIFDAIRDGRLHLDDTITTSAYAKSMGGSQVYLEEGETQKAETMIKCIVIASGNDASVAMAEHLAGSESAFVDMMNQELEKMGLSETTHFTNCVGIYNDDHYSTPYDMAMILKAAMDNDLCREVLGTRTYTTSKSKPHPDGITISNWFLRRIEDKDTHSEIIGAKTGFVNQSGSCAASMAQTPDGKEYICVTAGSTSSWRCIYDHVDIYDAFLPETAQPFESEEVTQ